MFLWCVMVYTNYLYLCTVKMMKYIQTKNRGSPNSSVQINFKEMYKRFQEDSFGNRQEETLLKESILS